MTAETIFKYFPNLSEVQQNQIILLEELYKDWNQKINVVSRKDIDELYLRHVLHSLGIAKVQAFNDGAEILDVGTGGGFPGVPLAILYPNVKFTLVDSIGKKIKVVDEVVEGLKLENVQTVNSRVEEVPKQFDFIVSRAVAAMPTFVHWVKGKIKKESLHERRNGILYLKGGDLMGELEAYRNAETFELADYFEDEFFETKKVVYLPLKFKG
ncbi:16S rRNA (guanine(527)-N(7))-methyltransferase RsmG [Maribacter sp. 4G9]|uniref:16S rRNA (guanine(527)-N(7))-methyltransferase RsmG n=1 Tax=Maribacter sp. 4G9 TaxID=1889777 RepID=UPI000C1614AF|nr:16S rRNA (guanine(527)-N(7))-methyltransferase RsmG [Maribacter sp. 4G9]PIB29779.1 16S rRNA (guanine(527)-N(7))-methyltransferase [Maribacter sp. 4G9]